MRSLQFLSIRRYQKTPCLVLYQFVRRACKCSSFREKIFCGGALPSRNPGSPNLTFVGANRVSLPSLSPLLRRCPSQRPPHYHEAHNWLYNKKHSSTSRNNIASSFCPVFQRRHFSPPAQSEKKGRLLSRGAGFSTPLCRFFGNGTFRS